MHFCNNLQGTILNTETFTKIDFGISLTLAVSKLGIRFLHGRNIFLAACNISLLCEISIHFLHEQTLGGGGVVTINFSFNIYESQACLQYRRSRHISLHFDGKKICRGGKTVKFHCQKMKEKVSSSIFRRSKFISLRRSFYTFFDRRFEEQKAKVQNVKKFKRSKFKRK